jgi:hypothetical protein
MTQDRVLQLQRRAANAKNREEAQKILAEASLLQLLDVQLNGNQRRDP